MSRLVRTILIANLCFWVYFGIAFFLAAEPYDPRPLGHDAVDPYSFGGYAIGLTRSSLTYPFMQAAFWIEFPSFLVVTLFMHAFFPKVGGGLIIAGISVRGYELLAIMALSFLQWYLIGRLCQRLWDKWFKHPSGRLKHAPHS